jgi:esterase/lipase
LKQTIKNISILLLIGYVGMGIFLFVYQRDFLYFPTAKMDTAYEEMTLKNENESINVIVLNRGYENAILYFGGNAESMAGSADYIAQQFPTFTVYLMDYRGYGKSTGEATEEGIYSDALKLYDTIQPKHNRISIGGRSLGSGVAIYVASKREVSKLALITPYDSIVSVAEERYPFYPVSFLLEDKYDSRSKVKDINATTFIVMAEDDKIITREHTQKLIDAFKPGQLEVTIIKNRGHIDISSDARYYKIMQDFIGEG